MHFTEFKNALKNVYVLGDAILLETLRNRFHLLMLF